MSLLGNPLRFGRTEKSRTIALALRTATCRTATAAGRVRTPTSQDLCVYIPHTRLGFRTEHTTSCTTRRGLPPPRDHLFLSGDAASSNSFARSAAPGWCFPPRFPPGVSPPRPRAPPYVHRARPRRAWNAVSLLTAGHHAVPMPLVFLLFLLPLPTRFHERSDQLKRRAQLADARPLPRTPRRPEGTRTRMDGQAGEPGSVGPPTARGRPPPNQTTANDNPNTSSPRWEAWVPKP